MRSYFARLRRGESLDERPRSGRPRKLTSTLRRQLAQLKRRFPDKGAAFYAAQLSEKSGQPVGVSTVQTALYQLGYSWRLPRRRKLTPSHKRERVAFASAHLADSWAERASADECTFNLYREGNRCWVRVSTTDGEDEPARAKLSARQEAVSLSIIAVICRGRKVGFAFLPRNWTETDLAAAFDRDVLPQLRAAGRGGRTPELMLDNDGRHHAADWLQFLQRRRLRVLRPWPSNSPDLNPVENVFAWLKAYVQRVGPTDEPSLRAAIEAAWQAFPAQFCLHMMGSMPERLRLCLHARGGRINY
jgi:DDE superfamily endonuclease/Transposase